MDFIEKEISYFMITWTKYITNFIRKKWLYIVIAAVMIIVIFLIFWFGLKRNFDWSTFLPNVLSTLITGILIVGIGGFIAWNSINRFQKQNEIARIKNDLINVIEDSYNLLSQILLEYNAWFNNQNDINASYRCNLLVSEIISKNKILLAKVSNQTKIISEEKKHELYLKKIALKAHWQINETIMLIIDNLSRGVEQGIQKQIVESINESYQKLSIVLSSIISNFKVLSKGIGEIKDMVKEISEYEKLLSKKDDG